MNGQEEVRILIVDDNPTIHQDFDKIFARLSPGAEELEALLADVFAEEPSGAESGRVEIPNFKLDHAYQGEEAVAMVDTAAAAGAPYALMFIDVRMPPGINGIEAIATIWSKHHFIEVVICTAYSDYSWEQIQILQKFGSSDQLLFLHKPFDVVSVKQMALALTTKWRLARRARRYVEELEETVQERTRELQQKYDDLEKAMAEIKTLQSILPMCTYCHKVRDDANYWSQVDEYIQSHNIADVSHGVCPECYEKYLLPMLTKSQADGSLPRPEA